MCVMLAGLSIAVACAPVHETSESVLVDARRFPGREQIEPGPAYPEVSITRHGNELKIAAHRLTWCRAPVVEERVIRTTTRSRTPAGFYAIDSIPLVLGGLLTRAGSDVTTQAFAWTFLALGGLAIAADASANGTAVSERTRRVRVGTTDPAPCRAQEPAARRVDLVLPDGATLAVLLDATGRGSVTVPPSLWQREGGVLDADVRVDGVLVRRLRLEQAP